MFTPTQETLVSSIIIAVISSLLTWLASKRKGNAEAMKAEVEAMQIMLTSYRQSHEDMHNEMQKLRSQLSQVYKQNERLLAERRDLKERLTHLEESLKKFNQ